MSEGGRRVVVLGAGVVGMACALYLQQAGFRVTVIDRNGPGEGCSKGNAGVFAIDHVIPLAAPGILRDVPGMLFDPLGPLRIHWRYLPRLMPWLFRFLAAARPRRAEEVSQALAALLGSALDAWRPLLAQSKAEKLVRTGGWLVVYRSEKRYRAAAWERAWIQRLGVRIEDLSTEALHQFVPALDPAVRFGARFPEAEFSVNSYELVQAMAAAFVGAGGAIQRAEVKQAGADDAGVWVKTDEGENRSDMLVLAMGAWSGPLAAQLGNPVPLDTERGYHVTLPQSGVEIPCPIMSGDYKMIATPMNVGLRFAGTVEFAGLEAPPDYRRARVMVERGRRVFRSLDDTGATEWMGFRPTLPDFLPVIGRSPKFDNVLFAFGHQHLGLTLAGITGRVITDLASGRAPELNLEPYRIERF